MNPTQTSLLPSFNFATKEKKKYMFFAPQVQANPPSRVVDSSLKFVLVLILSGYFDIFAVNSLTSLAATMAVIPSTVSRCGLNSTTSAATTSPLRL